MIYPLVSLCFNSFHCYCEVLSVSIITREIEQRFSSSIFNYLIQYINYFKRKDRKCRKFYQCFKTKLLTGCQAGSPLFWRLLIPQCCTSSCIGPSQIFSDLRVVQFPAFVRFLMLVEYKYNFRIST